MPFIKQYFLDILHHSFLDIKKYTHLKALRNPAAQKYV